MIETSTCSTSTIQASCWVATADGDITVWRGGNGLALSFTPTGRYALGVIKNIGPGEVNGLSGLWFIEDSQQRMVDGEIIQFVTRCSIKEISIVGSASMQGACCWIKDHDTEDVPPEVRTSKALWDDGVAQWWQDLSERNTQIMERLNRSSANARMRKFTGRPAANRSSPARLVSPAPSQRTLTPDRRPARGQFGPKTNHHVPRFNADIEQIIQDRLRGHYPKDRSVFR
jgi:hypothetical protein